jgi:hypothetical protein
MQVIEDPTLNQSIIDILVEEYKMMEPRDGIHSSDLIYCLTKSFYNKVSYLPPSQDEVMRFSIGLGLERVIIQHSATRVDPLTVDGVILSPDFLLMNIHSELKTTRWAVGHEIPEGWLKQVMNYCYATGHLFYNLAILHIIPAVLKTYRLFFDEQEIEENWGTMLMRKEILVEALESGEAPRAYQWNEDWECNGCRYNLRCQLAASLEMARGTADNVVPLKET